MVLTKKDIEHIADLARLELTESEGNMAVGHLSSILEYVAQLQKVDTEGITYQYQVEGLEHAVVSDEVDICDTHTRDSIVTSMPDRVGDLLKVKGVFGE